MTIADILIQWHFNTASLRDWENYRYAQYLLAPTKTDKQGESISKSDLYGHSVTTPDKQTLN